MSSESKKIDISCIVLAAGTSSRFGNTPKLLAHLGAHSILQLSYDLLAQFNLQEIVVVLGYKHEKLRSQLPVAANCVVNPNYNTGIASSLRCGIDALKCSGQGIIVHLADVPFVLPETIEKLITDFTGANGTKICVPVFRKKRGHPVIFPPSYKETLRKLEGDTGARNLIQANTENLLQVEVDDANIAFDIDKKSDLNFLK